MPALKTELLPNILQVFLTRGYDGATLAHLAEATGLSKASLYHHFPGGKQEMAATLVRQAIAELHSNAFVPLQAGTPPESLIVFIDGFAEYVQHGQSDCILSILGRHDTAHEDSKGIRDEIAAQFSDWHTTLCQAFEGAGLKSKRAERNAHVLMSRLYGALLVAKMHNKPELFARAIKRLKKDYSTASHYQGRLRPEK